MEKFVLLVHLALFGMKTHGAIARYWKELNGFCPLVAKIDAIKPSLKTVVFFITQLT